MTQVTRYDRYELKATRLDNGTLIDAPVLTRSGVFPYRQPDGTIRREYRPPAEVFHADSLAKFKGLPITEGHPGMVDGKSVRPHLLGTVISEGRQDGNDLRADIVINATGPVDEKGLRELSVGYTVELVEQSGTTPEGEHYDAIQTKITPNHLGLVKAGRAGNARLNLDSSDEDQGNDDMPKVRLDNGIEYEAAPEVIHELQKRSDQLTLAHKAADDEKARADKLQADLDAEKARADQIRAEARSRLELETVAKAHGVEAKADQSDRDVQAAVVAKLRPEVKLDGKDDAFVAAAFTLAVSDAHRADENADKQGKQASQKTRADGADQQVSAAAARQAMINGGA